MLRAVPERGAHLENVPPHRLWLDHAAGPHGFEQLIVCHQPTGVLDQMSEDRKGFRCQQDALLQRRISAPPETLVHSIETEWGKRHHRPAAGPNATSGNVSVRHLLA